MTGEPIRFAVDVNDNVRVDEVRVVYWFGNDVNESLNASMASVSGNWYGEYELDAVTVPLNTSG
ncbi:MAG: hypothetical protein GWN18_16655, partial [Thermoplasmata archaeon]|nr:hypothetical protein [Thermoplasmata archaeon]NIU50619.1 hypothetical protein [Thermoplasmata archaeon]NIW84147.1 hypothetical protein [Thermoplasmata archaeon]NIY05522.1 hypothetical protein [Thermoplasmata archaeon]